MKEEIFGPILPILTYSQIDDVIAEVRQHPKPLALSPTPQTASSLISLQIANRFKKKCCANFPLGEVVLMILSIISPHRICLLVGLGRVESEHTMEKLALTPSRIKKVY